MKTKAMTIRMPEELKNEFDEACGKNFVNASALIRSWIEKYVEENKEKPNGKLLFVETDKGEWIEVYIDDVTKEDSHFKALAKDKDGFRYMIRWEIKEGWNQRDEVDACDWDNPNEVVTLGDRYQGRNKNGSERI